VLYDLANTIFSMNVVSLYFSLWVVNVAGGTDARYGVANALSMGTILLLSPFLGALADRAPRRMPFLAASTLLCVALTLLLGQGGLMWSLAAYAAANIAYQAGVQFYDALLPRVSTPETRGRIGGLGIAVGYVGSFIGIAAGGWLLRDVTALAPADATARYARLFQVTAALFLAFAVPCFLWVRERPLPGRRFTWGSVVAAARRTSGTFRAARRVPGLLRFLAARALYTDAVNTVVMFMGIYVTNEAGFTPAEVSTLMAAAIACGIAGGYAWGHVTDRVGPKRALDAVLVLWLADLGWCAACGFLGLAKPWFWPVALLTGVALGGTAAADRPFLLRLAPPDRVGEYFGLYGMVGRFSAVLGPLAWGFVSETLGLGRPAAVLTLFAAVAAARRVLRPVSDAPRSGTIRHP
jgi:UMF1 family MFS transporter